MMQENSPRIRNSLEVLQLQHDVGSSCSMVNLHWICKGSSEGENWNQ